MEGTKYDDGKLRWDLVPWREFEQIVKVLTDGAVKYEDENWKRVPNAKDRYFAALLRHLTEYRLGGASDKESGNSLLAQVATNALFLLWFQNEENKKHA